jgi:hypothetical protein
MQDSTARTSAETEHSEAVQLVDIAAALDTGPEAIVNAVPEAPADIHPQQAVVGPGVVAEWEHRISSRTLQRLSAAIRKPRKNSPWIDPLVCV